MKGRVLVVGPKLVMKWTENIDFAFKNLDFKTDVFFAFQKPLYLKFLKFLWKSFGRVFQKHSIFPLYLKLYNKSLLKKLTESDYDYVFLIQKPLQNNVRKLIKKKNPQCKIIYWWGDIISHEAGKQIKKSFEFADLIALSYYNDYLAYKKKFPKQHFFYFPFGFSRTNHLTRKPTKNEFLKYNCDILFIGQYYPERAEALEFIISEFPKLSIKIYGRGWNRYKNKILSPYIKKTKLISLKSTLIMYQCARFCVNIHHKKSNNGFNMRFYEIPSSKSLQITEYQTAIEYTSLKECIIYFKDYSDLKTKLGYFLVNDDKCNAMKEKAFINAVNYEKYENRLIKLLYKCNNIAKN